MLFHSPIPTTMTQMTSTICGDYQITFNDHSFNCSPDSVMCDVNVKENKKKDCYVLGYSWTSLSGVPIITQNNAYPFVLQRYDEDNTDGEGVIVAKNDMTTQMIRYLVMSDEELQSSCGLGTESDYRAKIMRALATMWD